MLYIQLNQVLLIINLCHIFQIINQYNIGCEYIKLQRIRFHAMLRICER